MDRDFSLKLLRIPAQWAARSQKMLYVLGIYFLFKFQREAIEINELTAFIPDAKSYTFYKVAVEQSLKHCCREDSQLPFSMGLPLESNLAKTSHFFAVRQTLIFVN